jgi:hypothetical protein
MADIGDPTTALDEALQSAPADETPREERRRFGRLARVLAIFALVMALAFAVVWTQRTRIADDVIGRELRSRGIPATYRVAQIGTRRQVLADIVVGNPQHPDLTIKRAEVDLVYRLGFPGIGRITLVEPRLFGSYRNGKLSFGSLDPLLFTGGKTAFALPRLDLAINDGRALLQTDYGPLGIKSEGQGWLDDGFAGIVAVAAPRLAGRGCTVQRATYYGTITIAAGQPRLAGARRRGPLACPAQRLSLESAAMQVDTTLDKDFAGADGRAKLTAGRLALAGYRAGAADSDARFTWRGGNLTMKLDAGLAGVATPQAGFGRLSTSGTLRAHTGTSRLEYQGRIEGNGVRLGTGMADSLARAQVSTSDTLLAPLLAQLRAALTRETRGGRMLAEVDFRKSGAATTLVVPQASLSGGTGATLAALSRFSLSSGGAGVPRLAGNFTTGGPGLPRIAGRMERTGGRAVFRLAMAEYRAGSSALALPRMTLVQGSDGSLGFGGEARASGALPGGMTQNLVVPLDGSLGSDGAFALLRRCTPIAFDRLTLANLTLERRGLTLCPQRGRPIVRYAGGHLSIAAGVPRLDLAGRLGQTPIRLASGPVGFAYPGSLSAAQVDIALGPAATASRFRISNLSARVGKDIAGSFSGADVRLAATPLDITEATGRWRYAANRLSIDGASLKVSDRLDPPRFAPLIARDATLTLFANKIDAAAILRQPTTDRAVALVTLRHDLTTARGHADLAVKGLLFDKALQPADLTTRALGVIANAQGIVTGAGQIDWSPAGVTSGGRFATDKLDFAAAFGPVQGLSGSVLFTDLLGLVTAPDQEVQIAALNPGIEVNEGVVRFQIDPGYRLLVKTASWPFLGGRLSLAPTTLNLGVAEARKYTLVIEGLDAAKFVERMGLGNLSATGTFDGELPLVFSAANPGEQVAAAVGTVLGIGTAQGVQAAQSSAGSGRIVGGSLKSRPPGGNVSYVGELTYRDLSTMANFAFQTLRSLDYTTMDIALNGSLEGDIVTNVRFSGVRQGIGAKKNILTRAVANLPIEMRVNIRAPFYQLITSFKAMYDPAFVKDPRTLGLVDEQGHAIVRPTPALGSVPTPNPPQPNIQPSESERVP